MAKRRYRLEAVKIEYTEVNGLVEAIITKAMRYYNNSENANKMMLKFASEGFSVVLRERYYVKN